MGESTTADEMLKHNSNFCRCSACGEYFGSVYPFDLHRYGPPRDRKCRTVREMKKRGMFKDGGGYWRSKRRPDASVPQSPA